MVCDLAAFDKAVDAYKLTVVVFHSSRASIGHLPDNVHFYGIKDMTKRLPYIVCLFYIHIYQE